MRVGAGEYAYHLYHLRSFFGPRRHLAISPLFLSGVTGVGGSMPLVGVEALMTPSLDPCCLPSRPPGLWPAPVLVSPSTPPPPVCIFTSLLEQLSWMGGEVPLPQGAQREGSCFVCHWLLLVLFCCVCFWSQCVRNGVRGPHPLLIPDHSSPSPSNCVSGTDTSST